MTFIVAILLSVLAIQAAMIAALLIQRRALRQREAFFRHLADGAPMIMWTTRPDTTLDYLNKYCDPVHGSAAASLLGDGWLNAVHPDDVNRILGIYVPAIEARRPFLMDTVSDELTASTGGFWIPAFRSMNRMAATPVTSAAVSISPSAKKSEEALRSSHQEIQYLAGRLIGAQEVERARIARDLHDDVSQQLAGVSIAFSGLKQRLGDYHVSEELRQELVELQQQTLKLARNVRQLFTISIRPCCSIWGS